MRTLKRYKIKMLTYVTVFDIILLSAAIFIGTRVKTQTSAKLLGAGVMFVRVIVLDLFVAGGGPTFPISAIVYSMLGAVVGGVSFLLADNSRKRKAAKRRNKESIKEI